MIAVRLEELGAGGWGLEAGGWGLGAGGWGLGAGGWGLGDGSAVVVRTSSADEAHKK